jgi:predicted nucleic acid-binding Zn ribbon protein
VRIFWAKNNYFTVLQPYTQQALITIENCATPFKKNAKYSYISSDFHSDWCA